MKGFLALFAVLSILAVALLVESPRPSDHAPARNDAARQPALSRGSAPAAYRPWEIAPADEAEDEAPARPVPTAIALDAASFPSSSPERLSLPLPGDQRLDVPIRTVRKHANGDISLVAGGDGGAHALVTAGSGGVFARVRTNETVFQVVTERTGTWLIDLTNERLEVDAFGEDALVDNRTGKSIEPKSRARTAGSTTQGHGVGEMQRIDVMFLHPPEMSTRYPGALLETRLNHIVAIANQALVDSRVEAQVRLVHHEQTSYDRSSNNSEALADLRDALAGEIIPGLPGLLGRRTHYGADLVVLTWPHDIETRGSCGIAYLPQEQSNGQPRRELGVQISNDGASNWSVCSDAVFAHELGHNLGALHQRDTYDSPDRQARNFAWVRAGRWHTLMGSFPTGHVARYHRLDVFSNPSIDCGGLPCGSNQAGGSADNAGHMNGLAPVVAGYFGGQGTASTHPDISEQDQDGDGVPDRLDPYPFDPHDGQAPPQDPPPLVFEPRSTRTPADIGDWELLVVSSGNDQVLSWALDGRYRGVVARPESVNAGPILTEYSDLLVDGEGRMYLLASEDVRRFDRLSGRLIDVHLDSRLPGPRTLQSSFPRAMQWFGPDRLVVLGDFSIEIYDSAGHLLNGLNGSERTDDPQSWRDATDLPLRAAAAMGGRLFVAEAGRNRILSFSEPQGTRGADVASAGEGGLSDPRDMALGPDGLLYVANGRADNVLRFDPAQNRFVDEFVAAGNGRLAFARALAFGPDGDLFVVSRDSHAVLRFDGQTGAFRGVVADADSGPLDSPQSLVIAPVIDEVGPGHSGHYFVPARSGEGWLLEILDDDRAAISWFTYSPAGTGSTTQAWLVGVGDIEGSRVLFEDMLTTRLIDPEAPIESGNIETLPWGTLTLEFGHCGHGRARFDSPLFDASGELDFVRLVAIEGLPCGSEPLAPGEGAPGISGQWNDPDSSGQGWFFQELGDGRVFTAWFTYDQNGEQAWVVGEGRLEGRRLVFEELIQARGTAFGGDFDPDEIEQRVWGRLELTFENCNEAVADFESVLPGFGQGQLAPKRLTRLDGLDCALPD